MGGVHGEEAGAAAEVGGGFFAGKEVGAAPRWGGGVGAHSSGSAVPAKTSKSIGVLRPAPRFHAF